MANKQVFKNKNRSKNGPRKLSTGLKPSHQKFVDEYLKDPCARRAALAAGYSKNNPDALGAALLSNPKLWAAIEKAREETAGKLQITRERIILEYARIAFGDIVNILSFNQEKGVLIKDSKELSPDITASLSEVGETLNQFGRAIKVKVHDKVRALDMLVKLLGYDVPERSRGQHTERLIRFSLVADMPSKSDDVAPNEDNDDDDDQAPM